MNEYLVYDDMGNLYSKDVHYVEPGLGYIRMEYFYADENGDLKLDMRENLLSHELKIRIRTLSRVDLLAAPFLATG